MRRAISPRLAISMRLILLVSFLIGCLPISCLDYKGMLPCLRFGDDTRLDNEVVNALIN